MNHIEAMKQALEALEMFDGQHTAPGATMSFTDAITSLRQAIQEEALRNVARLGQEIEQEPVAWWDGKESVVFTHDAIHTPNWTDYWTKPLYTTPLNPMDSLKSSKTLDAQPQREWAGLTDDDIEAAYWQTTPSLERFARAVEAKLRSKNQ